MTRRPASKIARAQGERRDDASGARATRVDLHELGRAQALALQTGLSPATRLARLQAEIASCRRCPRLVAWREQVARERRAAFARERYWGRPVPGFGDPKARVYVLGLAPAAHGGNRTGRVFSGDRSGDWLIASMYRSGFASQPHSVGPGDGLHLDGAYIAAAVRCAPPANRPLPEERANCLPYAAQELELMPSVKVVVCLGALAWETAARLAGMRPKPRFAHGAEEPLPDGRIMVGCFHPSQQNTFTGKLTRAMLDAVFSRARELAAVKP